MQALLVIDMQRGDFPPYKERFDHKTIVDRINILARKFRKTGNLVVFIQHDGSKEGAFIPGTEGWDLLPELEVHGEDKLVGKTANSAFYRSQLDMVLKENQVISIYVTGSATDFCVESTIQGALAKDYKITVVADAHTTGNRPHASPEQIIAHYNWVWSEMTPTNGSIRVLNMEEVLEEV